MKVLVINDLAGRFDRIVAVLERARAERVAAIFVLGNLGLGTGRRQAYLARTRRGDLPGAPGDVLAVELDTDRETYLLTFRLLGSLGVPVYLLPGAYDTPPAQLTEALEAYHGNASITLVHGRVTPFGADGLTGVGGDRQLLGDELIQLQCPTEEGVGTFDLLAAGTRGFRDAPHRIVLLGGAPRAEQVDLNDETRTDNRTINWVIERYHPRLICCAGHADGRSAEVIDGTLVVHPGSLARGSFALVDLDSFEVRLSSLIERIPIAGGIFRSIVVGLDDSPAGEQALTLATALARAFCAHLTLVHALEPDRLLPFVPRSVQDTVRRSAERLLVTAAEAAHDVEPECELREGDAATVLARVAAAQEADLIVLGTTSDVSRRLSREVTCPLLIARPGLISYCATNDTERKEAPEPSLLVTW